MFVTIEIMVIIKYGSFYLMTAPFLHLVFPLLLCFMAVGGFLVFYLESQQYTAREKVLRGVAWHSFACLLAAALLAVGQGMVSSKSGEDSDEVATLHQQLDEMSLKNAVLEQKLVVSDRARSHAEQVALASEAAQVEMAAKHADLVIDLTMAHHQATSAVVRNEVVTLQQRSIPAAGRSAPIALLDDSDRSTVLEKLREARSALGASINPLYRSDTSAKQEANSLIQAALKTLGAFDGLIQGDGLATVEAVKDYQVSRALPVTGIVGERTMAAMEKDIYRFSQVAMSVESWE